MYQFIVNPSAGTGKGYRIWKRLEKQLENEGREYRVFFTENRSTIMRSAPCIFTRSRSRRKNCIYRSRK